MQKESGIQEKHYRAQKISVSIWKQLFHYAKPYRWDLLILCICNLAIAAGQIAMPLMSKFAIDYFVAQGTFSQIGLMIVLLILLAGMMGASSWLFINRAAKIEQFICYDIRKAAFAKLQELSYSYYDITPVGYIMSRMSSDIARLSETIAWSLVDILWAFATVIGVFIAMFCLNVTITLWVLLVMPVLVAATIYFQRRIFRQQRIVRRTNSRITGALNESIIAATTTKTLVREDRNFEEFSGLTEEMQRASIRSAKLSATFFPIVMFLGSVGTAIALLQGGMLVMGGVIEYGSLFAFVSYTTQCFEPLQSLARIFAEMQTAQASAERVLDIIHTQPEITDPPEIVNREGDVFHPKPESWPKIRGKVEFSDVSFAYRGGQKVLEHFSLTVQPGQTVALVGKTGAGKSTIVNLLCRFYEPTSGKILIDDEDIQSHSQLYLQSQLGYVLQSPHLFSGTVMDNIRYGKLDATDEEVYAAARLVSAEPAILKLEKGYQTEVGEGGNRLSTGEKQLISFARAVLGNPPLFVLDEATSSIDTQTEALIQKAITATLENRTSFLIAHRLSTIRTADLIVVLDQGKIIEQGNHQSLMAQKGHYYRLYNDQFKLEQEEKRLSR